MIHQTPALSADLRRLLKILESDLHAQTEAADVASALQSEYHAQRETDPRTTETYSDWLSERATRIAIHWLLDTVFLRFCEDNELVPEPYLTGPDDRGTLAIDRQNSFEQERSGRTGRDWLLHGFDHLRSESSLMLGTVTTPPRRTTSWDISDSSVGELIEFWRRRDENGRTVHDFTCPPAGNGAIGGDTRFLGDLYQNLADGKRKDYALLQTPDFVVEFILDHTLEPAVSENGLHGLRTIDPVCGSGTFIVRTFERLVERWSAQYADEHRWTAVRLALDSIHAVDRHPTAVAITRFRLMIAAMQAGNARCLADMPANLSITVACGDSLLDGLDTTDRPISDESSDPTAVRSFAKAKLLRRNSYDAVVGNPPYIVPRNSSERDAYRDLYPECVGLFSLTVPFTVRFFDLASADPHGPGFVGLLISNSFMKREFGRKLIEDFFPSVDLTGVVDTSGAYIPGHGTPTVILFGRNRAPSQELIPAVLCTRGESVVPPVAAEGKVWRSIASAFPDRIRHTDTWTQGIELNPSDLHRFPWNLTDPGSTEVLRRIDTESPTEVEPTRVADLAARIGYFANTGSDDVFISAQATFQRGNIEEEALIPVLRGSDLRDWKASPVDHGAMIPHGGSDPYRSFPNLMRRLWPFRAALRTKDAAWYRWHHIAEMQNVHPWRIAFTWVSTHNHFVVLRDRVAPLTSAPIIRMPNTASNSDILQLTALLNSSVACFWLKHNSNRKSQQVTDQLGTSEPWLAFYEFTSNRVGEFPLPHGRWFETRWTVHAEAIDELVREIADTEPRSVVRNDRLPTASELAAARARWTRARRRLVGLQEELDWEIYERYGLVDSADSLVAPASSVPELKPGERAFEIVLARRMLHGDVDGSWFERNGIEKVAYLPDTWPIAYRETVERRIKFIEERRMVDRVELPEFKRRWQSAHWDSLFREATTGWILNRLETPAAWSDGNEKPRLRTIPELAEFFAKDPELSRALSLIHPDESFDAVIRELITGEHVPCLAALRYRPSGYKKYLSWIQIWDQQWKRESKNHSLDPMDTPPKYTSADFLKPSYWRLRGKLDVPNERFISFPLSGGTAHLFGWAGWNHSQRAQAIAGYIRTLTGENAVAENLVPLLAGLLELEPWLARWHPNELEEISWFRTSVQLELHVTVKDLVSWRPDPPKRGRPRKTT